MQMVKQRLGIAGGVLFKANCQGVPIIAQPRKEHKIREHNTDMTEPCATMDVNNHRRTQVTRIRQVPLRKHCTTTSVAEGPCTTTVAVDDYFLYFLYEPEPLRECTWKI